MIGRVAHPCVFGKGGNSDCERLGILTLSFFVPARVTHPCARVTC